MRWFLVLKCEHLAAAFPIADFNARRHQCCAPFLVDSCFVFMLCIYEQSAVIACHLSILVVLWRWCHLDSVQHAARLERKIRPKTPFQNHWCHFQAVYASMFDTPWEQPGHTMLGPWLQLGRPSDRAPWRATSQLLKII